MPLFKYTARNANAEITEGSIDSVSMQTAREALRNMGLQPESLVEIADTSSVSSVQKPAWQTVQEAVKTETQQAVVQGNDHKRYFPIMDTLELYAGWLLAGYFFTLLVASYALTKPLPFEIPFVLAFLYSPLILSFTLACFLFLFARALQKRFRRGYASAFVLTIASVGVFILYRVNT